MQSLRTSNKREAARLSRVVSVKFDDMCSAAQAIKATAKVANEQDTAQKSGDGDAPTAASPATILARIPQLMKEAARAVVEEQQRDPVGWQETVCRWKGLYEAMLIGAVPAAIQRPAVEARALLNGIQCAIDGTPLPEVAASHIPRSANVPSHSEPWDSLVKRALALYVEDVGAPRHRLIALTLGKMKVTDTSSSGIQEALNAWCQRRLDEVKARTVRTQLDGMVVCLRHVVPDLQRPNIRVLKGVLQPNQSDRQSMPVRKIRETLAKLRGKQGCTKSNARNVGASPFDAIVAAMLAYVGLRPKEIFQARPSSLVWKPDIMDVSALYFRIEKGKTKSSDRDIPLSDGKRSIVDIDALRELLAWLEKSDRSPIGLVSTFGARFKKASEGYTPYQMRHTWSDLALRANNIDPDIRGRIMGHSTKSMGRIYGSGIPLDKGLNALFQIREAIEGTAARRDR